MALLDDQVNVIVKGFEQERDDTLANTSEMQCVVELTDMERRILAHAAVRSLRAAGYEIIRSNDADRR